MEPEEPQTNLPEEDRADIRPDLPGLRTQEGIGTSTAGRSSGGATSSTAGGGFFNAAGDKNTSSTGTGAAGLAASEAGLGSKSLYNAVPALGMASKVAGLFGSTSRRRKAAGGGIIATIIGIVIAFFTFASGPFEFVHIAQLMEKFHFTTQQDESDDRFTKIMRYARYKKTGEVYKTNLGIIGNRVADNFEVKLNEQGLKSAYTEKLGFKDGYEIDKKNANYKGKTDGEITQALKEKYGDNIKVTFGSDGTPFMEQPSDYLKAKGIVRGTLREAGYSKVTSAVGARIMGERDGVTWHPLRKLDNKLYKTLEEKYTKWREDRVSEEKSGADATVSTKDGAAEDPKSQTQDALQKAADRKAAADGTLTEGSDTAKTVNSGGDASGQSLSKFTDNIGLKITTGTAAAVGILCAAQGIAKDAGNIKQAQVKLPLVRAGVRAMSEGNQIMSGQDIDWNQLSLDSEQLYDATSKTSWAGAQSIEGENGEPIGGNDKTTAPDETLTKINSGTPFDAFLSAPLSTILTPVCSTGGQVVQTIVGFLGGPFTFVGGTLVGMIGGQPVINTISHYLAGDAVDAYAKGAKYGNYINYGSRLAANDQALSAGGRELSDQEVAVLDTSNNADEKAQFDKQDLAYRLFNPNDHMSLVSSLMDHQSGKLGTNLNMLASGTLNAGRTLATTFSSIFSGVAKATPKAYDYGFPEVNFSADEMNNSDTSIPQVNGDAVAGILDADLASGSHYIQKAQTCFGDTLGQVTPAGSSSQVWDVQYGTSAVNTFSQDYKNANCSDTGDHNWLRIRFFIFDTQDAKSADCFDGTTDSSAQSCTDVGFNTSSSGSDVPGNSNGPIASGSTKELAQKLLDYRSSGKYRCDNAGDCTDLQKMVDGQSLAGSQSCIAKSLDPRVLQLLIYLIENGNFKIGTYAMCGDHGPDSPRGHNGGFAVDISSVNGAAVNQNTPEAKKQTLALDKFLNNLPSDLRLSQQITYGYGNHPDSELQATQQFGGKVCGTSCPYPQSTEQQHMNHVHAGF